MELPQTMVYILCKSFPFLKMLIAMRKLNFISNWQTKLFLSIVNEQLKMCPNLLHQSNKNVCLYVLV